MTKDEALKMALEWFESVDEDPAYGVQGHQVIAAIKEALAQPEQEPVAWATREDFYFELNRRVERMRKEMEVKTVTMRCKEYDLALPIVDMYGGHIVVGQVSFPPQRKPLTDEEERKAFEQWYVCNAFDYERNPIGSRECGLQWSAWKARAAHGIKGEA